MVDAACVGEQECARCKVVRHVLAFRSDDAKPTGIDHICRHCRDDEIVRHRKRPTKQPFHLDLGWWG